MDLSILKKVISRSFHNFWFMKILELLELDSEINKKQPLGLKTKKKKTLIWLDDIRDPDDIRMDWLAFSPIAREVEVIWLKDYYQFKNWIIENGLPDAICFDHDLGEETPSGYECAKWLVNYCLDNNVPPPLWSSQSANPVGKANINRLLRNFLRSLE